VIDREANRVDIALDRGGSSPRRRLAINDRKVVYFSRDVFSDPLESPSLYLAQQYSHPPTFVSKWLSSYGDAAVEQILSANNGKSRTTARVNTIRTDRDALLTRVRSEEVLVGPGARDDSILLASPVEEVIGSAAFKDGWFYLQDETAMEVVDFVAPRSGERILDLCAAPGGKTSGLFAAARGEAKIVANDNDESRLQRLRENLSRLGCGGIELTNLDPLIATSSPSPQAPFDERFDAVLIDAPCSNTGVFRRRPEVRWKVDDAAVERLAKQGLALLSFAADVLKPGGRIVYSTCSIEGEENGENVRKFVESRPAFRLVSEKLTLPARQGGDGGYVATMIHEQIT
jgi:16S rRNA (cytosine967-C5)-methyltransferase